MKPSVLIIDDHPSFRAWARALLELDGLSVIGEAADGATGVRAALSLEPSVVLLDVNLPDSSGFMVAARLRAHGTRARIVLASAYPRETFAAQLPCPDADGFVRKDALSGEALLGTSS
jgi:DNA-binding NarL/FixJ family response regulator